MFKISNGVRAAITAIIFLTLAAPAFAAEYPTRPITLIVPYAAGGGTDTQARIAGATLEKILGKPLTIVNKTGGNGVIGFSEAAAARPNGYTLGYLAYPDVMVPPMYKKTNYKTSDFVYIASFNSTPTCLIVRKDAPFQTLSEYIEYAKKNPGKITVGIASDSHMLATVMLDSKAGISTTPVSYKSGSEALNAILGKHIDVAMIAPQFGKIALQENLNILGVTSEQRIKVMPEIPTFSEQGFDIVMLMNRIFVAPKGTPDNIINILSKACEEASQDANMINNVERAGDEYIFMAGEDLMKYIEESDKNYVPVIQNNLKLFSR